jgi:hypothetical protein
MNTPLPESCSLEEVLVAIGAGCYPGFLDIPARHHSEATAIAWLEHEWKYGTPDLRARYEQIPANCRTFDFMCKAATFRCDVLKDATPEQYADYEGIARTAIVHSWIALHDLDLRFREKMVGDILSCWNTRIDAIVRSCKWLLELIPDDLVEVYAGNNMLFAFEAQHRLQEPLQRYVCLNRLSRTSAELKAIREMRRLDLLADKIREGHWFRGEKYFKPDQPNSLQEGILWLNGASGAPHYETLYLCYVMTYPIEEVVPAMEGSRLKKLLLEMYSAEALAPFMKVDAGLRGVMLEEAMGL